MKEKTSREEHAEARREQIIQAALKVFSEKGFLAATNKDIAAAAGIAPGLIYHYFKD
nr:TetR family transcriptional regulator [bacterium]